MAEEKSPIKIGLHSVRNLIGEQNQLSLFSHHDKNFSDEFGVNLINQIDQFGAKLTELESRVMEGILKGLSDTSYKGNIKAKDVKSIAHEKYDGKLPPTYKYMKELPRLRASQSEILQWAGIQREGSQKGGIEKRGVHTCIKAIQALKTLGTKQFCFYYNRLAYSEDGKPLKDKNGNWKKEEVIAVDTLFTIKEVRDSGIIKYYEITPSSIFLDQVDRYFMLIPYDWREEVKNLLGNKKSSSYTFRLLLFLRYQYELKRRSANHKPPYRIKWSPDEIAIALKMPESVYKRKKKRADEILENAYETAKRLGYLSDYERKQYVDVLTLRDEKFAKEITVSDSKEENANKEAYSLFQLFHDCRKQLDPNYRPPSGAAKTAQIKDFESLLKQRAFEDIEKLIHWSVCQSYWCSFLSTPSKLRKNFSQAWIEFTQRKKTKKELSQENHSWAKKHLSRFDGKKIPGFGILSILGEFVEINDGKSTKLFEYVNESFQEEVTAYLQRFSSKKPSTSG